jgi:hypothetical protein
MATSKSNEARTVHRLKQLWRQLDAADGPAGRAPSLGYRGVTLECGAGDSWFAYGGTVSRGSEHRRDPERRFERELLQSAPAGLIPDAVLRQFG